ncbi:hypothetical protein CRYUN_Cryun24cG0106300 [Craigia yunnanensis]
MDLDVLFWVKSLLCDPSIVHIAMTIDPKYLRGTIAAIHSVLKHDSCPANVFFHFIASDSSLVNANDLTRIVKSAFPSLSFKVYIFQENLVRNFISSSIRQALDNPLNYARSYLADILEACIESVMVMDSVRWREGDYTKKIERWMRIQKERRIYELGSLPPFLLVFGGDVEAIDHRWNQHGLGGDNLVNSCRPLHPGPYCHTRQKPASEQDPVDQIRPKHLVLLMVPMKLRLLQQATHLDYLPSILSPGHHKSRMQGLIQTWDVPKKPPKQVLYGHVERQVAANQS